MYDTFGQVQGEGTDLEEFDLDSGAKLVVYSWNLEPSGSTERAGGASGYLSKVLTGPEIVSALERVMGGAAVVPTGDHETAWTSRGTGPVGRHGFLP